MYGAAVPDPPPPERAPDGRWPSAPEGRIGLACAVFALAHHVLLSRVYFGQEEGDYGNLGLILGTLQSGFTYIETEHMPLFSWLAAAVCAVTGDAHTAALLVALPMGAATAGLVGWLGARWLSPPAGLVAGLLVAVQPDLALTASTTLRTSTYTAFAVATVVAAGSRRPRLAGLLFGGAFLTRFDAMYSLLPMLAIVAVVPALHQHTPPARRGAGLGIAAGFLALWAALYHRIEGTPRFWEAVVARNTGSYEELSLLDRALKGTETLELVGRHVIPDHVGWAVIALVPVGLVLVLRGQARQVAPARILALTALGTGGVFVLEVLLSAYRWDHNLYWRWLALALPFALPLAAHGAVELVRELSGRRPLAILVAVGLAAATALPMYRQTWHQLIRSDVWIGTQVRIASWAEGALAEHEGATLLAEAIPATWLSRREGLPRVLRWGQLGDRPRPGDAEDFAAWLRAERVRVVLWFAEDWVGAAERAPFLAAGEPAEAGGLRLVPVAREEGYGVIAYRVDGPDLPALTPPTPDLSGGLVPPPSLMAD